MHRRNAVVQSLKWASIMIYIYIYIQHISEGSLVKWKAMVEQEVTGASTDINVEKERERERDHRQTM